MNKMYRSQRRRPGRASQLLWLILFCLLPVNFHAQSVEKPLTSQELVHLVYQLPSHPEKKDEVVEEIRRRGIGFPLTDGLRSVVASKSGNDALVRRTLEEAERRRLNPTASALPSEAEGLSLLAKAKVATLAATEAMPDFIVKELIIRSYALAGTNNWNVSDRLTVAVSYRSTMGEEYKVLAVNGMPAPATTEGATDGSSYMKQVGGATSTGEYVSELALIFDDQSRTEFKPIDTDLLRGHRTIVYEYRIKKPFSHWRLTEGEKAVITAYHGRVWVDRESFRVLRIEMVSDLLPSERPPDFSISAVTNTVDYDWVTIAEHRYLLPSSSDTVMTSTNVDRPVQNRNLIRFRGYQKFGSEVKIIEDIDEKDMKDDGKP